VREAADPCVPDAGRSIDVWLLSVSNHSLPEERSTLAPGCFHTENRLYSLAGRGGRPAGGRQADGLAGRSLGLVSRCRPTPRP
jgi:hypothetical protein